MSSVSASLNLPTKTEKNTSVDVHLFTVSPLRLQERRRSSVVVSLPGLDVSPGDLFVSNGAADRLNGSNFSGNIPCYDILSLM